ncbi:hypothetical protein ACLOJK_008363 [Asimina triloba]
MAAVWIVAGVEMGSLAQVWIYWRVGKGRSMVSPRDGFQGGGVMQIWLDRSCGGGNGGWAWTMEPGRCWLGRMGVDDGAWPLLARAEGRTTMVMVEADSCSWVARWLLDRAALPVGDKDGRGQIWIDGVVEELLQSRSGMEAGDGLLAIGSRCLRWFGDGLGVMEAGCCYNSNGEMVVG